jgi:universal stress protein E
MKNFKNVLYVSHGLMDESSALKQALSISRNNNAELAILIVCPEMPAAMASYKNKLEMSLVDQVKASVRSAAEAINRGKTDDAVGFAVDQADPLVVTYGKARIHLKVESGGTPAVRIVQHALRNSHDLLIKEAEPKEGGKGFRAVDMELLRKCPFPVLLSRPISRHRNEIKVAVAVDPESPTPEGLDLSKRLLEVSRAYANTCNGELHVISCWNYEFEKTLLNNPWIAVKKEDVEEVVVKARNQSRTALDDLIQQSKISGEIKVHHIRGTADSAIPKHLEDNNIDVLIMGTVGRTGIPGFIIGNTAENIVQKLGCSLLALKPNGFVSPVKAY